MKIYIYTFLFLSIICIDFGLKTYESINFTVEQMELLSKNESKDKEEENKESESEKIFATHHLKFAVLPFYNLLNYNKIKAEHQHFEEIPIPPPDFIS